MWTNEQDSTASNKQLATSNCRRGFTLVEMLTVIGIIVLLVSILLPVVSAVRTKGHAADSQAMLARIATGIEAYYADMRAYPGPLSNAQVHLPAGGKLKMKSGGDIDLAKVTMSENLVLGLLGGLYPDTNGGIRFDPDIVGNGPANLSLKNPKRSRAYMDKVSLSERNPDPSILWKYSDEAGAADDSPLPEFVDRFPSPMPILYLRAKIGATGIASNSTDYAQQQQYDLNQVIGYTGKNIGVGRDLDQSEYKNATYPQHGLRTVDAASTIFESNPPPNQGTKYVYPYDFYAYMRHPSIANTPKQKDGFLLISPGPDRVYGTKDDLQYPSSR
jgi:prepilin-type N-terminal cleavage/methylation domain-containing protein